MQAKLRTAIIGLGWAATHRHIPALRKHPAFVLVGVIDGDSHKTRAVAQKYALPHTAQTHNLDDVTWLDSIDVLILATPPETHAALAIKALRCGKHVLIEKPFACDESQAAAMAEAAKTSGKTLCVVHNFLFCRAYRKLVHDLAQGRLGLLTGLSGTYMCNTENRLPPWHRTLPLGAFANECPHFLSLLYDLTDGVLHLRRAHGVTGHDSCTPALIQLLYYSHNKMPVTLDYIFSGSLSEWHLMVKGDKATALIDLYRDIYIYLPNDHTHKMWPVLRTSACAIGQHLTQHVTNAFALLRGKLDYGTRHVYDQFALSIETGQPALKIGIENAVAVAKLQSDATKTILGNLYS